MKKYDGSDLGAVSVGIANRAYQEPRQTIRDDTKAAGAVSSLTWLALIAT